MSYITLGEHNKEVIGCPITMGEYNALVGKYEQDDKMIKETIEEDQSIKLNFVVDSTWNAFTTEGHNEIYKRVSNLIKQGCINKKHTVFEIAYSEIQKSIMVISQLEIVTVIDSDILKYLKSRMHKVVLVDSNQQPIKLAFIKNGLWMSLTDEGVSYVIEKVQEYVKSDVDISSGSICELVKTDYGNCYKVKFRYNMDDDDVYISLLLNGDVGKYIKYMI